ncbi:hypothetical protein I551_7832 [Mycobacterium ulcerans str. Harvey]|uniref:Uncharacterized protein n=1 Tax=Mycobacterium ulcerans str. Harvey TaxID=1299332 RepID=A0ABN0QMA8_MYCUL|nr:hypothetical protein I551_7832 [Mycobacterium ulcerans str. Harvey]
MLGDDPLGPDHQPLTLRGEPSKLWPRLIKVTWSSRSSLAIAEDKAGCDT